MKNLSNHQLWTLIETETPSFTLSLSFSTRSLSLTFNCEYFHHKSLQNPSLLVAFWVSVGLLGLSLSPSSALFREFPHSDSSWKLRSEFTSNSELINWSKSPPFRHFRVPFCWFHSMINKLVDLLFPLLNHLLVDLCFQVLVFNNGLIVHLGILEIMVELERGNVKVWVFVLFFSLGMWGNLGMETHKKSYHHG